jgi:ferredoxin
MKRKIILIDDVKCSGCGDCIPNCPEGALQMIDGKARLLSDLFCDGLGACIGHCPEGAITIEEREAEPYSERKAMENISRQGAHVIQAHLEHLMEHNENMYFNEAIAYLQEKEIAVPMLMKKKNHTPSGCPGSREISRTEQAPGDSGPAGNVPSELRQWPVQLTLLNPNASFFNNADLVIAADCVPFAMGNFHSRILKGKALAILCPKLDQNINDYIDKLGAVFKNQSVKSVTIVNMEVPCCFGIRSIVQKALEKSGKNIPLYENIVSLDGKLL